MKNALKSGIFNGGVLLGLTALSAFGLMQTHGQDIHDLLPTVAMLGFLLASVLAVMQGVRLGLIGLRVIDQPPLTRWGTSFRLAAFGLAFLLLLKGWGDNYRAGEEPILMAMLIAGLVGWVFLANWLALPAIARPDVLSAKANLRSVMQRLGPPKTGVFCGETVGKPSVPLRVGVEDRGVVIGPPGTGKTAFMVTQLLDWAEQKRSFVCLDIKPELHGIMDDRLRQQGYQVWVINPSAPRHRYNLLDDITGQTGIGELAASLIPADDNDHPAFAEGARDVLDGIISLLRARGEPVSLPGIRAFLSGIASEQALIQQMAECDDPDVREIAFALSRSAKNGRFIGSVFATLRSNLRFLRYDTIRDTIDTSDFSLRQFLDDRPVALFLQFEERHQETTRQLLTALISHLFQFFIEHSQRKPVLLMLDEIGNVPRIPGLVEKLNTIRSRGLPTWLYWQSTQQMQKYGQQRDEGPNAILAACDFQMVFRLNDNETARWFSERVGTADRTVTSITGEGDAAYGVAVEAALRVEDLQALPVGQAIAAYRGLIWRNQATPYHRRWPEMRV